MSLNPDTVLKTAVRFDQVENPHGLAQTLSFISP